MTESLKFYFDLQRKMIARQFVEYGINPLSGLLVLIALFLGISWLLFQKLSFAAYVYPLIPMGAIIGLNEPDRVLFLRHCFSAQHYRILRLAENGIISLPFIVFLCVENEVLPASGLMLVSAFLSFFAFRTTWNRSLPTPFPKRPFEFLIGFRKTWLILIALYVFAVIVSLSNLPNLGIGILIGLFLTCFTFYNEPENPYYIWIFSNSVHSFLWRKASTALVHLTLICLLPSLLLYFYFPENWWIFLWIIVAGYLGILTAVLAKYARFPAKQSLEQSILIAFCYWFPPMLIVLIVLFYTQSVKSLKALTHDNN